MRDKILNNVVVSESGCWEWQLSGTPRGYGRVSIGGGKQGYAHRESYKAFKGEIPDGLLVRHSCDNPRCCNPNHLDVGTQHDNMQNASRRGRTRCTFKSDSTRGELNVKAKLTSEDALFIFTSSLPNAVLAKRYNVSPTMVGLIKRRKAWQHVTSTLESIA